MIRHLVAAAALGLLAGTASLAQAAPDLTGTWVSPAPENMGAFFATRTFTFDGDRWGIIFAAYGDEGLTDPMFTLDVDGYYLLGAESEAVPGATEGIFTGFQKSVTAHNQAAVDFFGSMGCSLTIGEPMELVTQSCGFFHAAMDAMGEYDLVQIIDGQLFLGDRSGDLTETRPTALTPWPVVRQ